MKKRIICAIVSSVMILSLVGCTNSTETQDNTKEIVNVSTQQSETKTLKEASEQELLEKALSNNCNIMNNNAPKGGDEEGVLREFMFTKCNAEGFHALSINYEYYESKEKAIAGYNSLIWQAEEPCYEVSVENYAYTYKNAPNYTMTNEKGDNYLYHTCQTPEMYFEYYCIDNTVLVLSVADMNMKEEAIKLFNSFLNKPYYSMY